MNNDKFQVFLPSKEIYQYICSIEEQKLLLFFNHLIQCKSKVYSSQLKGTASPLG
ncbi:MAG: hypothetical protein ACR5KW_01885 [Wolbachia sp.]